MEKMFQILREEILNDIDQLHSHLSGFRELLRSDPNLKPIALYSIPLRNEQRVGKSIKIHNIAESDDMASRVAEAMTEIYMIPGQSPQESIRMPGAILCSPETYARAQAINELKLALCDKIDRVEARQRRNIYRLKKSLHAVQMRRIFELGADNPKSISLFWHGSQSTSRIRVKELQEQLLTNLRSLCDNQSITLDTLPEYHYGEVENGVISALKVLLEYDPREVLARIKVVQPHIRARISYIDSDGKTQEFQAPASLPVLFSNANPKPKLIGSLESLDASDELFKSQNSKLENTPLIASIDVYRYNNQHRKYLEEPVETKTVKRKTASQKDKKNEG